MKLKIIWPLLLFSVGICAQQKTGKIAHKVSGNEVTFSTGYKTIIPPNPVMGHTYTITQKGNNQSLLLELTGKSDTRVSYRLTVKEAGKKNHTESGIVEIDYSYLFNEGVETPLLAGTTQTVFCMPYTDTKGNIQVCLGDAEDQDIEFPEGAIFVDAHFSHKPKKPIHLNGFLYPKK